MFSNCWARVGGHWLPVHVSLVSICIWGDNGSRSHYLIRYKTKHVQTDGTVQRVYVCCQTTASDNNREKKAKTDPEAEKKSRDARRMSRFSCKGMFYVTARNGVFDCVLKHSQNHVRYKDIRIPDYWRQYIIENHKDGPTKVSIPCFV